MSIIQVGYECASGFKLFESKNDDNFELPKRGPTAWNESRAMYSNRVGHDYEQTPFKTRIPLKYTLLKPYIKSKKGLKI
jgi:hypothetical protein